MVENGIIQQNNSRLEEVLNELKEATKLTKAEKANKFMGQLDLLIDTQEGIDFVYHKIGEITEAGIFEGSVWNDTDKLVPALVNGTYKSGHPGSTIEVLSELRILAIVQKELKDENMGPEEASDFLEEVLVANLEFVFNEPLEETRLMMSEHELKKVHSLFNYISERIHLDGIKTKLVEELTLICEQRPVVTEKQRRIIALIKEKMDLDPESPVDAELLGFQNSIYCPTTGSKDKSLKEYKAYLSQLEEQELLREAGEASSTMLKYGLVSPYHGQLLLYLVKNGYDKAAYISLGVSAVGEAKWFQYQEYLTKLILETVRPYNCQCIYGLSNMLENGIISRSAVRSGLSNIRTITLHPKVENRISKSNIERDPEEKITALQYLVGALIRILGQPLGVGQGNNPTCQSARGISMWSQYAPGKLINLVMTAATHNDLTFRFEGQEITASLVGKGLVQKLDYNLDSVSVVLVGMLDKIYNEMMLRASGRLEDPHKWVNPALYGQWIQIGFASAYDYKYNAIVDFDGFVKIFYATSHPLYNGNHQVMYPNPVGIFVTTSTGKMLGFHAISLLRVDADPSGEMRAYFLNPNNEGRQDWGQGIKPSVFGNGELHGESSLPVNQFAARMYAFHYNVLEAENRVNDVPDEAVKEVRELAQESWGKSYNWIEINKKW
ncbi:hypothetical protein [Fulvivirga sediminis]|uniref:Uncharacterized protein n=1 Tax=Fulvivirga sediminis TaxID=2803949 RepID=A0A937FA64_9BACT|nr:hypothetical protein [Fulvivirga sediminis]MBL3657109.1 hypothetical protein [Fulvivirga sediminis]